MADCSFAKKSRLLNAGDYKAVFDRAQHKVSSRYFLILAINNECSWSRLGLVVAKKNIPTAVQRNRVKRLARDYFRLNSSIVSGLDLVVLVRKDADKLDNKDLSGNFAKLLQDLSSKQHKTNSQSPSPS